MNLKVANLVAIQFGMFLGIISWLAYSQLPFGEPRNGAEVRKPLPFATASNPDDQILQTVNERADRERTQPAVEKPVLPAMQYEYSPAAVQQNSALAAQLYYQQIAPRPQAGSGLANSTIVTMAPYAAVAPAPAVTERDDPMPETVAYAEPTQVIVYPQAQFVAFSDSRRFGNRCRPVLPVNNTPLMNAHRRLDRGRSRLSGSIHSTSLNADACRPAKSFGVVHRRNDSAPGCRPSRGFAARGRR